MRKYPGVHLILRTHLKRNLCLPAAGLAILLCSGLPLLRGQERRLPATPLSQSTLDILADAVSGQVIYNNELILAGAPWVRDQAEFTETLDESGKIHDLVRGYGIETVRLDRYPRDREFEYPMEGEFWLLKPEKRLLSRLEADAALIARGSATVDVTGNLVYLPPLREEEVKAWTNGSAPEHLKNSIALMWSHPSRTAAEALEAAGILGTIAFSARDRYFDPDQVVYSGGSFGRGENLKFGFTVSWRQWTELLEDVEEGKTLTVRCRTRIEKFPDKLESVFCWIPGREPEGRGLIFTAHLFEGYTKRGANDNISGCVVQLEILRALTRLIDEGTLPRPRRTISFLWPNEISGTYEHIARNPGFFRELSANINMDMVGEALRKNNALFTMTESPGHLPSYLDGLGHSIMNYVWRGNDIVYLPDSPRGRRGQHFPRPLWEKNGSRDAFRFWMHRATGGSDHICFNNPAVAVPGIELNIWPDQWYHADTDTPDKSDPTQLKRTAFIGAAMVWAAANCTDDVLEGLLEAVSAYGYKRVGERELPRAMALIQGADREDFEAAVGMAFKLIHLAVSRESGAVRSVEGISTGSEKARRLTGSHLAQWESYEKNLNRQILGFARLRAGALDLAPPDDKAWRTTGRIYDSLVPSLRPEIMGRKFSPESLDGYREYTEKNPDVLKELDLDRGLQRTIQNYVDGRRTVMEIRILVEAETGQNLETGRVFSYLEFLQAVGWLELNR